MKKTTQNPETEINQRIDRLNTHAWEIINCDVNKTLELIVRAKKLAKKQKYQKGIADYTRTISFVQILKANYTEAWPLASKALQLYLTIEDNKGEADVLNIMGIFLRNKSDYEEALNNHKEALEIFRTIGNKKCEAETLCNIGSVHLSLCKYQKALKYYEEALELLEFKDNKRIKADILKNIGDTYRSLGNNESALNYTKKSLSLYEILRCHSGKAKALNNISLIYGRLGMYSEALKNYNISLKLSQKLGNIRSETLTLGNIGIIYQQIGSYSDSLANHFKSLKITRKIGDQQWEAKTLNNIAIVYQETGEYKDALEYYRKSEKICKKIGDKFFEAIVLKNISEVFELQGNSKTALDYLQKSLPIIIESGDENILSRTYNDIADVYRGMGKFNESIKYYKKHLKIAITNNCKQCHAEALLGIGSVLILEKKHNKAINKLKEGLPIAEEIGAKSLIYNFHELLSKAYEGATDFKSSLKHCRSFCSIKEEILNIESDRTRRKIIAIHDVETAKCEAEINKLRKEKLAKQSLELKIVVEEKNKLLEERKVLIGIAAHDLRNPIFEIQEKSFSENDCRESFDKLKDRMSQINKTSRQTSRILENLLSLEAIESGKIIMKQTKIDFGKIINNIVDSHAQRAKEKSISILYEQPKDKLFVCTDNIALKSILDNLISNSVKYSPQGKNIYINFRQSGGNVCCEIKDEGPGLTSKDKEKLFGKFCKLSAEPTGNEHSAGLGLSIVKSFVEKMGGRVWCESEHRKGAKFIFELPQYSK